ncbi:hypothetical protein Daqu01_01916 [Deinococcus aquaticus]
MVMFDEGPDREDSSVAFQISLFDDGQDEELGMDTYCLVLGGRACTYGGILAVSLIQRVLTLTLAEDAQQELGITGITVDVTAVMDQWQDIQNGLIRVLSQARETPDIRLG